MTHILVIVNEPEDSGWTEEVMDEEVVDGLAIEQTDDLDIDATLEKIRAFLVSRIS